jgi:asparagine synthase (glutamine-hydrolysing)
MCGITGIRSFINSNHSMAIRSMNAALAHRGPDADGFYDEDGHIYLGHRRLSIIDLSAAANQPLFDESRRYAIIYNGEIYNYRELRSELAHYPFKTQSDSETILAAYIQWGADCLEKLKGMFAFAIWDKSTRTLFIARDRLGVKPLYYYQDHENFLFASELRAIIASTLIPKKLDEEALAGYFAYQSFHEPQSPVAGIRQLPAGSYIIVSRSGVEIKKYWDITQPTREEMGDLPSVQKRIRALLLQSVERRLVSDVPVAAFLSGGIDSSAVVGLMAEIAEAPQTFTIGFSEEEYDESSYAALIAKKFNTRHHNIHLQPSVFLDELSTALNSMDIPSGDGINSYVVSKAIRQQGIKVALSGVGGDELFAGYPIFNQWLSLYGKKAIWKLPVFLRRWMMMAKDKSSKALRMQQLMQLPACDITSVYPVLRQVIPNAALKKLTRLPRTETALQKNLARHRDTLSKFPLLSQVSLAEYMGYTANTLLKDTDQMSMAVALEVREPFFDHELIEYVVQVPDAYKKPTYPKSLLVESLGDLLPSEIVHRKKQGFLLPWEVWMKNELRGFCNGKIEAVSQRSFIQGSALRDYWKRFCKGDATVRWSELWLFIVLENWLQQQGIN